MQQIQYGSKVKFPESLLKNCKILMLFINIWNHLKSHGMSKLDFPYDENMKLRKFWRVRFKKSVYLTKMLKIFSKFWHHLKLGLEQGFPV